MFQLSQVKDNGKRVLAAGLTGGLVLDQANSVCSARQLWRLSGNQIVNTLTGSPLVVGGVSAWEIEKHPSKQGVVYIKNAGAGPKSNKAYFKWLKLGRKYEWRITEV